MAQPDSGSSSGPFILADDDSPATNSMNAIDTNVIVYAADSEDLDAGTTYDTVTVLNPFA